LNLFAVVRWGLCGSGRKHDRPRRAGASVVYEDVTDRAPCYPFYFRQVHTGDHRNFAYILGDPATKDAALVDAVDEIDRLVSILERDGYRLTHAFATHSHGDHAGGIPELAGRGAKVVVHASWTGHPRIAAVRNKAHLAHDGETVLVGTLPIQVLHTPGHTPDASVLVVGAASGPQALLGGDTLLVNCCGRCDVSLVPPEQAERQMFASLQRIKRLRGEIELFPGHYYLGFPSRSLEQQRSENPALAVEDFELWRRFWFLREYD
jgi:hydroxyacylglutathione hydrolase